MNGFGKLQELAKNASSTDNSIAMHEKWDLPDINVNSGREDLLDYIMIFMCNELSLSELAFKGGYLLTKIIPNHSRMTQDIDFSIMRKEYYDIVKDAMIKLGESLIQKGVCESYEIKDTIEETMSGGIKIHVNGNGKDLGIDVGLHDLSYGITKWDLDFSKVSGFEVERMLSDKLSAMYSRKRFRRSKDLYDFYIITSHFDVDLDKLKYYISLRINSFSRETSPIREEVLVEYKRVYDKLILCSVNEVQLERPDFEKIISRLALFDYAIFDGVGSHWNHELLKME